MRVVFMGTPDFAVPVLEALAEARHDVIAAYTQPPRPAGRGKKLRPSPVQAKAEEMGIAVRHPATLRDLEEQAAFAALDADVAVVAAYGLLLPSPILEAPAKGCLNVHGLLLPRWRGAAPIQRAILAGDHVTGVTIMQMEKGLDTGPMLMKARVPVEEKTAGELHDELSQIGAGLMVEVLSQLDQLRAEPQDGLEATHAAKIDKGESRLDFHKPALRLEREVRAFSPFPGSWFELDGERIKVLRAHVIGVNGAPGTVLDDQFTVACGEASLRPELLQRAGKPAMPLADFLRGFPVAAGTLVR